MKNIIFSLILLLCTLAAAGQNENRKHRYLEDTLSPISREVGRGGAYFNNFMYHLGELPIPQGDDILYQCIALDYLMGVEDLFSDDLVLTSTENYYTPFMPALMTFFKNANYVIFDCDDTISVTYKTSVIDESDHKTIYYYEGYRLLDSVPFVLQLLDFDENPKKNKNLRVIMKNPKMLDNGKNIDPFGVSDSFKSHLREFRLYHTENLNH